MNQKPQNNKAANHHLDASQYTAGRLASKVSRLLMGKYRTNWQPHIDFIDTVTIDNIKEVKFTGKKPAQKMYYRVSGYLGGIKKENLETAFAKDPKKLFSKIVANMLPRNRLRAKRLKRLKIN